MHERFGHAFSDIGTARNGFGSDFMEEFERHKRNFSIADEDRIWTLRLVLRALDERVDDLHAYYDFQEYKVKLTWYVNFYPFCRANEPADFPVLT